MKIPKEFTIFGSIIKTKWDDNLTKRNNVGEMNYPEDTIYLQLPEKDDKNFTDAALERTYYHELIHCFLFHIGKTKLANDEMFVENLSGVLHQFMKTVKY